MSVCLSVSVSLSLSLSLSLSDQTVFLHHLCLRWFSLFSSDPISFFSCLSFFPPPPPSLSLSSAHPPPPISGLYNPQAGSPCKRLDCCFCDIPIASFSLDFFFCSWASRWDLSFESLLSLFSNSYPPPHPASPCTNLLRGQIPPTPPPHPASPPKLAF